MDKLEKAIYATIHAFFCLFATVSSITLIFLWHIHESSYKNTVVCLLFLILLALLFIFREIERGVKKWED